MTSLDAKRLRRIVANIVQAEIELAERMGCDADAAKKQSNAYRTLNRFIKEMRDRHGRPPPTGITLIAKY